MKVDQMPILGSTGAPRKRSVTTTAILLLALLVRAEVAVGGDSFSAGVTAYERGDFDTAARAFHDSASAQPAAGTFLNLGNAEWKRERTAGAILAWERALWLNPREGNAKTNLAFARSTAQLESPQLAWHEVASTWLPANTWVWIAAGSLWLTGAMLVLPGIFRGRKSSWHQAVAALGLGVFILSLPANFGVITRSRTGFITAMETPLRLTPTANAEMVTKLSAGEPARLIRTRGNFLFIRTSHAEGWVESADMELICGR